MTKRIIKYKSQCPHCGEIKIDPDYTTSVCEIPHIKDDDGFTCPYILGGLPTKMLSTIIRKDK